jgi:hypothetical protein
MRANTVLTALIYMILAIFLFSPLNAADPKIVTPDMLDAEQTEAVAKILEQAFESQWKGMDAGVAAHIKGEAFAENAKGQSRELLPGSGLQNGDTIKTAIKASLLIIMPDAAIYKLGEKTTMKVNAYAFKPEEPNRDQSDLKIEEGIVSYRTGKIGNRNPAVIKYRTPTMVAGILGSKGVIKVTLKGVTYYMVIAGKALVNTDEGVKIGDYGRGTLLRIAPDGALKIITNISLDARGRITAQGQKKIAEEFGDDVAGSLTEAADDSASVEEPSLKSFGPQGDSSQIDEIERTDVLKSDEPDNDYILIRRRSPFE